MASLTSEQRSVFLTRNEYDKLVRYFPNWMRDNWESLYRRWSLDGVVVTGPYDKIQAIRNFRDF